MKILTFIFDLFRLLFISFYVRFKNLNAKSRFLTIIAYVFILNIFFNLYLINSHIRYIFKLENGFYIWGIIHIILLVSSTIVIVYLDFQLKNDTKFIIKYKKIITHNMFEYIIFILFFIFVIIVKIFDKNSVF